MGGMGKSLLNGPTEGLKLGIRRMIKENKGRRHFSIHLSVIVHWIRLMDDRPILRTGHRRFGRRIGTGHHPDGSGRPQIPTF